MSGSARELSLTELVLEFLLKGASDVTAKTATAAETLSESYCALFYF